MTRVGLLHPGAMGATIGATLVAGGSDVLWCAAGRSQDTRARAAAAGLTEVATLAELCAHCEVMISVCPPEHAIAQAIAVCDAGFRGVYVDANAIAPASSEQIAKHFTGRFVDGGIIGPPASRAGTTRLYLSGAGAAEVAALFHAGPCAAQVVTGGLTAASALKMSYAAYTKGLGALLLNSLATAEAYGVRDALIAEWALSQPDLERRAQLTAAHTGPKAWRFAGEMHEIAATMIAAGLPGGFHEGAAEVYSRMAPLQHAQDIDVDLVLRLLRQLEA